MAAAAAGTTTRGPRTGWPDQTQHRRQKHQPVEQPEYHSEQKHLQQVINIIYSVGFLFYAHSAPLNNAVTPS